MIPLAVFKLRQGPVAARKQAIRIEKPESFLSPTKPVLSSPSSSDFFLFKLLIALSYLFSLLSLGFSLRAYVSS